MEKEDRQFFKDHKGYYLPYPHLDEPNLQKKISIKKEFQYKYDGEIGDVASKSEIVCKKEKRELFPHQEFIKKYISSDTPYNGVLLYHGLGSGKTCSAIGITESLRTYSKYTQNFKKILIVASPNVQENFKLQLFNPSALKKVDGMWNLSGCVGNSLIHELNISQVNELSKEVLIQKINDLIKQYYKFIGYIELANYIEKFLKSKNKHIIEKNLKSNFEGRIIVIDEIHNIRLTSDSDQNKKKVASMLKVLVQYVKYIKFIFLTGTPMYNDPKEIIFILNILNANDNRTTLAVKDVFDKHGELKVINGEEVGKQALTIKANGYISYVRGENPYAFPFLVTPKMYDDPQSIAKLKRYPIRQFNNNKIEKGIQHLDLYLHKLPPQQAEGYQYFMEEIVKDLTEEELEKFEEMDSVTYTMVMAPIMALNINYRTREKDKDKGTKFLVGKEGLKSVMRFRESANPPTKNNFEYKDPTPIFAYDQIGNYSVKIKSILDNIILSKGIVLVYSQYIDGGLIPMALALEELGFKRYMPGKSLLKEPREPINVYNLKRDPSLFTPDFEQATYAIISGDKKLSPNNKAEVEALTHNNMFGERVKVVLISQAGSEGIDLNYLRQVHIMEPWYNMNRIEQIIGRARRNCSHTGLPVEERNVQVFLHATQVDPTIESMDMFLYRNAEKKSVKIGKVCKILKSVAIDCLLNIEQQNFAKMKEVIHIKLSNHTEIDYEVKDQPFSSLCDYSESCEYTCINSTAKEPIDKHTYTFDHTKSDKLINQIKHLYTLKHVYHEDELYRLLKTKTVSRIEIERAVYDMINDTHMMIDKFGRKGTLVHIHNLFLFQPIEIKDKQVMMYQRTHPITYKPRMVEISETASKNENESAEGIQSVMAKVQEQYDSTKTPEGDDWYSCYYAALEHIKVEMSEKEKEKYLVEHICESLTFEEDLQLINHIYTKSSAELSALEKRVKRYYNQFTIENDDVRGIILVDRKKTDPQIYVFDAGWNPATYEERGILKRVIKEKIQQVEITDMFKWIGYMGYKPNKSEYVFKVIDTTAKKISGAAFDDKLISQKFKIINETIEDIDVYNKSTDMKAIELSIIEEIYLRMFDKAQDGDTRYFLNKLESFIIKLK